LTTLRYFIDADGRSPFRRWREDLDSAARVRVTIALARLAEGNTGNAKAIGGGLNELKIDWGPGLRVYFGWHGSELVILLGGGTKQRQSADILAARRRWSEFKTAMRSQEP